MKLLVYTGIGLAALWLQLTVAPLIAVWGIRPNVVLLTVAVMGLRWLEPWLFIYGALTGLALDAFSHNLLGVYAISLFAVSFLARLIGVSMYENSLLLGMGSVFALSLADGLIAATLFNLLDGTVPWWAWVGTRVLPAALLNALLSPAVFLVLGRLERFVRVVDAGGVPVR